jgi:hypothetical protein
LSSDSSSRLLVSIFPTIGRTLHTIAAVLWYDRVGRAGEWQNPVALNFSRLHTEMSIFTGNMADKNELREKLKRQIDIRIPKLVQAHKLDEAADAMIRAGKADRQLLEKIGSETFGERGLLVNFSNTDIDDINDILNQIKGG